ncbi:MAG: hypothetical protein EBU90_11340 [Proteobacteria bacterium]|nr:hypothetical protein [Pseudomonadota bacterium]
MSIFKVNPTDFQSITVTTNPFRHYSSSSKGTTGSILLFSKENKVEKDVEESNLLSFNESTFANSLVNLTKKTLGSKGNIYPSLAGFLDSVNKLSLTEKNKKVLNIVRFTPTTHFTSGTLKKLLIKDNLSTYYRCRYPSSNWGYSNYHSLNFFSSSTVPTSSVLLYPNIDDGRMPSGYAPGRYAVSGAFSFDFYINPRYRTLDSKGHFKAGTIFHLSSSYALSLVTGSEKDVNGLPAAFRLQLQLSHSADIPPSLAIAGSSPKNFIFLSNDNALKWNHWHHVVVRWGTNLINNGTGSFNIDGVDKGTFVVPSSSIAFKTTSIHIPYALCIGNFYEGRNNSTAESQSQFFNASAYYEGTSRVARLITENYVNPTNFSFNHPLQAELHDLSIKRFYVNDFDIISSSSTGITNFNNVCFYVPPFFTMDSPIKVGTSAATVNTTVGVPYSLSYAAPGITTTPFNTWLAFGVNGHYINTENFLKDFAPVFNPGISTVFNTPSDKQGIFPRQYSLSASLVQVGSNIGKTANEILYSQPSVRKRNLTILPCDDGNFYPNYDILLTSSLRVLTYRDVETFNQNPSDIFYTDDLLKKSPGFISLNFNKNKFDMIFSGSRFNSTIPIDQTANKIVKTAISKEEEWSNDNVGFYPEKPTGLAKSQIIKKFQQFRSLARSTFNKVTSSDRFFVTQSQFPLSIPVRTQDISSNQVTFFDISNLFYGMNIEPGSFTITDSAMTGSGGSVSITIKDDGNGTLYRADSLTPHCTWNSVGTIYYDEGIIAIKNPHLYFFGQDQYELSFRGEQNLHILRVETAAPTNYLNSSSNPSYANVPSTLRLNEFDKDFVYITGINYHDDNLNVIMKTQLAQPIMKRPSEKMLFRVKFDF